MAETVLKSKRVIELAEAKEIYLNDKIAECVKRQKDSDERPVGMWETLASAFGGPRPYSLERLHKIIDLEVEGEYRRDLFRVSRLKALASEVDEIKITDEDYKLLT